MIFPTGKRTLNPPAIRASPSCARGNARVSRERISNWLSSNPPPRPPVSPPRHLVVTPAKPQSPNCNPVESVPDPRTPPIRLPKGMFKNSRSGLSQHLAARASCQQQRSRIWAEAAANLAKHSGVKLDRAPGFTAQMILHPLEPVKPSPSREPASDFQPEPATEQRLPQKLVTERPERPRDLGRFVALSPNLTTVAEQTERSSSMTTMSLVPTTTDSFGPAPSPCKGLSLESAAFSQSSTDSFGVSLEHGTTSEFVHDKPSSALSSMSSSDRPLDPTAFSQAPVAPAGSEAGDKTEDEQERALVEDIVGQRFDDYCADAIAGLPVRDECKDETSLITGYESPQLEPLRPVSQQQPLSHTEILALDPFSPEYMIHSKVFEEAERVRLEKEAAEKGMDLNAPSTSQSLSVKDAHSGPDSSASLDEVLLPKVTLAAPPPPQADVFGDCLKNIDVRRLAPAAPASPRPNLFADLVLREQFHLPAIATAAVWTEKPIEQPQHCTGILCKITTKAIAMAKAAWSKVKSLVGR